MVNQEKDGDIEYSKQDGGAYNGKRWYNRK